MVDLWLSDNPLHIGLWTEALRPVRQTAACRSRRGQPRPPPGRQARVRRLHPRRLRRRPGRPARGAAAGGGPQQYAELFPKIEPHRQQAALVLLRESWGGSSAPGGSGRQEPAARRQAQAAVHAEAGGGRPTLALAAAQADPGRRTYLTLAVLGRSAPVDSFAGAAGDGDGRVGGAGPDPEPGGVRARAVAASEPAPLVAKLLEWYRTHPDAGVHGAIDWLLRHGQKGPDARPLDWGQAATVAQVDGELAGQPPGKKGWYVTTRRGTPWRWSGAGGVPDGLAGTRRTVTRRRRTPHRKGSGVRSDRHEGSDGRAIGGS